MPRLIRVFTGCIDHFVGFIMLWLKWFCCVTGNVSCIFFVKWVSWNPDQKIWLPVLTIMLFTFYGCMLFRILCYDEKAVENCLLNVVSCINEPDMTKPTKWVCAQRRLRSAWASPPLWSESSRCAQWVAKDSSFHHVGSEDSDQTGQMPRLIWVFAGRTLNLLVLSYRGSNLL